MFRDVQGNIIGILEGDARSLDYLTSVAQVGYYLEPWCCCLE